MRHSRLLKGPAPVLVLVVAAAVAGALRGGFTDLFVYQYGGRTVLDGLPALESGDPVTGLPFTYPPFAAVVMVPLALLPAWLAAALWTGASVGNAYLLAALALSVWAAATLNRRVGSSARRTDTESARSNPPTSGVKGRISRSSVLISTCKLTRRRTRGSQRRTT